jgi:large subunit ribosomal protein L6
MSKIGKKSIILSTAKVEIKDNHVIISGPKAKFEHELSDGLEVVLDGNILSILLKQDTRINRINWGMNRALLANKVKGVETGFEQKMKIVGLGYKAQLSGKKITFALGYSHKIDFTLPKDVDLEVDKSGQNLTFKSVDKALLGEVCAKVRGFRPPEPYKGTGIMKVDEVIIRKAGKTKAAQ